MWLLVLISNLRFSMYSAIHLGLVTALDPSQSGFVTEESAEQYVYGQMCEYCQADQDRTGSKPSCRYDWVILLTTVADQCETVSEYLQAAGFTEVV